MNGFGERLKKARMQNGYNQKQFAGLLGVTPTRLNYWEKDKREPDFFMFSKIVKLLNADANKLLGLDMDEFNVSAKEKEIISSYRLHPEMHAAINKMLDINYANMKNTQKHHPFSDLNTAQIAAYGQDVTDINKG